MSQPEVTITELDGAIGIQPSGANPPLAVIGACDAGTANVPAAYGKTSALIAAHTGGPAVEFAAYQIEKFNRPVILVPTGKTTAGSYPGGAVTDQTGTGTSVATVDQTTYPNDDYEAYIIVTLGGTIGTGPITFQYSLDGGRTLSPPISLGTALDYIIPGSGGVEVEFAAGTLVTGDTISFRCDAPQWDTAELTAALTALKNYGGSWELVHIVGEIAGADFDAIETAFTSLFTAGKYRAWVGNTRIPDWGVPGSSDETEAAYLSALDTIFTAKASTVGELCAGSLELISAISGRQYRRPVSWHIASKTASVSEEINIAAPNLGAASGITLTDANGNPKHHDESVNPGLDDVRFTVMRTIEGLSGVYVNRPRIFSAAGSDFEIMPHRRVLNLAHAALRLYFLRRLSLPIQVDADTGFILEDVAQEIEAGADAQVRAALMAEPKASGGGYSQGRFFQLNRDDNLLSTKKITGQARVVPLAYPEYIDLNVGFYNPSMVLVT
jgi:hypothetical protein